MIRLPLQQVGGANVAAFMDTLAWAEGTDNGRQATHDDGYDVIVGGALMDSYADHPRKLVELPRYGIKSTAAGRYQFTERTWDDLAQRFGLRDFSPENQDRGCVYLLRQCRAYAALRRGDVQLAMRRARTLWASLPNAGYGQHEQDESDLVALWSRTVKAYEAAGLQK